MDIIPLDLDTTPETAGSSLPPAPPRPGAIAQEDPHAEADREDAFSHEPVWNGKLLPHGLAIERYTVFVSQRLAMGAPSLYLALQDGNAFYPDALRILWLCSVPFETITALRKDPDAMQAAIDLWATETAPIPDARKANMTAIEIFNASQLNRADPRQSARSSNHSERGN